MIVVFVVVVIKAEGAANQGILALYCKKGCGLMLKVMGFGVVRCLKESQGSRMFPYFSFFLYILSLTNYEMITEG